LHLNDSNDSLRMPCNFGGEDSLVSNKAGAFLL
jgi:hypothetical protein